MNALCSARQARAKRTSRHDFHPRPEYTVVFQDADDLVLEMKRDEYAQRVNARPVGGPRSNLPRPRSDPGWAAQGGGGRNIRSPPRTGPWIGPGVVAEPPREPRRAVLGCVDIYIILDICQQLHFRRNNGQRCLSSFAGSPGCTSDGKPNVSGSLMLCYGLRGLGHNGGCCRQSTVNGTASTSDSPAGVTTEYGSVSISISSMTPTWNTSSSTVRSSGHILRRLGHPKKRGPSIPSPWS